MERRTVFQGRLLTVHDDTVETVDGNLAGREIIEHPGAVAIVAIDADGRVVLVRQWCDAIGRALWDILVGTLTPWRGARIPRRGASWPRRPDTRAEDLGVTGRMGPDGTWIQRELLHLFAARQLTSGETHTDPDEHVIAQLFTAAEAGPADRRGRRRPGRWPGCPRRVQGGRLGRDRGAVPA